MNLIDNLIFHWQEQTWTYSIIASWVSLAIEQSPSMAVQTIFSFILTEQGNKRVSDVSRK